MKYAIIKNGVVENIIEAEAEFAEQIGAVIAADDTSIGYLYDGVAFYKPLSVVAKLSLPEYKVQKITSIRAHFDGLVAGLKADAAPYEVETWAVQTTEYSAWAANNTTPTPYVSALAAARSMTLADLMAKIGAKVAGLASIQGMQHALEAAVNAATTQAELDAVVF